MNDKEFEQGLGVLSCCPYCEISYETSAVKVLERKRRRVSLHVTCAKCKRAMLLSVTRGGSGMTCAGIFTDCIFEDAKRFHASEKVTPDDVLAVHQVLRSENV